jgi:hypothetical protein
MGLENERAKQRAGSFTATQRSAGGARQIPGETGFEARMLDGGSAAWAMLSAKRRHS